MSTPHHPTPPEREAEARALLAAATDGARRALRGHPRERIDEAAAAALPRVIAALLHDGAVRGPLAFAATAGCNAGADLRLRLDRDARRLAPLEALDGVPATPPTTGWADVERRLYVDDARAVAARRPTRECAAVADALARLLAGEPIDTPDEAARKRLARGIKLLVTLLAA